MTEVSASPVTRAEVACLAATPSLSNSQREELEMRCKARSAKPCQLQLSTLCSQHRAISVEVNERVKRHLCEMTILLHLQINKLGSYLISLKALLAILHGQRRIRPCHLMDRSSHRQAAAYWTAVMACPRGILVCLIISHSCGVLKLLFNYSSQMCHLN